MSHKPSDTPADPIASTELTEIQSLLQTHDTAPVDETTVGMHLAELIIRVRNMSKRWQRK